MMKSFAILISMLSLLSPLAYAGVVMDMVTRNASGQEAGRSKIYVQSGMIRMDEVGGNDDAATIIFRGQELLYLDHREKSYFVMDEAMLDEVSAQISDAMKQMQAQLASMPPEQRAMAEQMMKGRMQGMMGQQGAPSSAPRVEAMGSAKWSSYTCQQYAVYEGATKTEEVCAAELSDIDGADEVIEAFRNMSAYMTKMIESMPMQSKDRINPSELMDQIEGFPVRTVDYENGLITGETSLDSVAEQELEQAMFIAPEGYRRQDPFRSR